MDHDLLIQHLKGVRKVVINGCHGGFDLSDDAWDRYCQLSGHKRDDFFRVDIDRDDPYLIQVIEELGIEEASGDYAELKIVEIPADVEWEIGEYDGMEWVAEKHRKWE